MRTMQTILLAAALALMVKCAGSGPPLPDRAVEERGRTAAELFGTGKFAAAMEMYRRALVEAEQLDLPGLQARYWFNIGRIYYECSEYDSAMRYFRKSRMLFIEKGRGGEAMTAEIFMVLTRAYAGDADSADILLQMLAPAVGRDDQAVLATARTIVGLLKGDPDAADRECVRALELLRRRKDVHGLGVIYYYKAMSSFMRGERGNARQCLDTSLIYFRRSPARYRTWRTLLGRAIVEYGDGKIDEGDNWYRRAAAAAPDMVNFPSRDMVRRCPSVLQ